MPAQSTLDLHRRLRNPHGFELHPTLSPRMLPHAYEPVRLDVAVQHTPAKVGGEAAGRAGRRRAAAATAVRD